MKISDHKSSHSATVTPTAPSARPGSVVHGNHGVSPARPAATTPTAHSDSLVHGGGGSAQPKITPPATPGSVVHDAHGAGSGAVNAALETSSAPARVGESVTLSFVLTDRAGAPAELVPAHTKLSHAIVVSNTLATIAHIHPAQREGEAARHEATFSPVLAGPHSVFLEVATSQGTELKRFTFDARDEACRHGAAIDRPTGVRSAGSDDVSFSGRPLAFEKVSREATSGSTKARLASRPSTLVAKTPVRISFELTDTRTGRPASGLEPYLGAPGHAIAIDAGLQHFLHLHPVTSSDGEPSDAGSSARSHGGHGATVGPQPSVVAFETTFPGPGTYRLWAQFRRAGEDLVMPFVLKVR